jgi:hypothetical protein
VPHRIDAAEKSCRLQANECCDSNNATASHKPLLLPLLMLLPQPAAADACTAAPTARLRSLDCEQKGAWHVSIARIHQDRMLGGSVRMTILIMLNAAETFITEPSWIRPHNPAARVAKLIAEYAWNRE